MRSLKWLGVVLLFLVASTSIAKSNPASRLVTGSEAKGGEISIFLDQIKKSKRNRVRLELVTSCYSSCTLYTALLEDGLLCAWPGTKLIFHQFVNVTDMVIEGNVLKSFKIKGRITGPAFDRIWQTYPYSIRRAIVHSPMGGLPPHGQEWTVSASRLGIPRC